MTNLQEVFDLAVRRHQEGQLAAAEELYRKILHADPRHADALHLLGVVAFQSERLEEAATLIGSAIRLAGNQPMYHGSLGEVFRASGRLDEAAACYQRTILLAPQLAQPHYLLGTIHVTRSNLPAAQASFRRAVTLKPDFVDALFALGNIERQLGNLAAARASYEQALVNETNHYDALLGLAGVLRESGQTELAREHFSRAIALQPQAAEPHLYLGNLEAAVQNLPQAIACYHRALELNPEFASAHTRLGDVLRHQGRRAEALVHWKRAAHLAPNDAEVQYDCGTALWQLGRTFEAAEHFAAAVKLDPCHVAALMNLGTFYQETGQPGKALERYERALELDPNAAEVHHNRGMLLLQRGQLTEGWQELEWRFRLPSYPPLPAHGPPWDGSPLTGQTLLLHPEQGLGDTLQFIRYAPLAQQRSGAKVVLRVQAALVPLLRQSGFENLESDAEPVPPHDRRITYMSLPGLLGTTLENIPANVPYLSVPLEMINAWRTRLPGSGFRIGLVWQGNTAHPHDAFRSVPLQSFEPLARVPGVSLISLQKGTGAEQLRDASFIVHTIDGAWDTTAGPFVDTAAIMKSLDLVISVDTATAHLAGALGVKTWVALSTRPDWRWLLDREITPWYPTMRLFRQARASDWDEVFDRMACELRQVAIGR